MQPTARVAAIFVAASLGFATASTAQWTPPLGIPAPSFGVVESAPAVPNPWLSSTAGFYYVDATQATATDTSNTYGTPAKPRRTIPTVLPAGSVVELHGTYDYQHSSPNGIFSMGTSAKPVFIRGASSTTRPLIRNEWEVRGTYFVLENLEFGPLNTTQTGQLVIVAPTNYAALRYSDLHGNVNGGGLGVVSWDSTLTQNVVVLGTYIHDNGDVNATFDQDNHGIAVSNNVDHLWVVDSQLARNSGDGIQINAGSAAAQATTHHIYVGRNVAYSNKQTGFWAKQAVDVIFSQNDCHSHRPSNSSFGQCMGYQYATDQVWFLFNHIYDSDFGIAAAGDSGLGTGTQAYYVGNVIHNIHTSDPAGYNPATSWSNAAIMLAGGVNRHVINNTIYDVDAGINTPATDGTLEVADNIISNVTVAASFHVFVEMPSLAPTVAIHHNVLQGDPRVNVGGTVVHLTAAQLASIASTGADPKFTNAAGADFHLLAGSSAIDTGETNSVYATFQQRYGFSLQFDRDGLARPQGAAMDMGAYEFGAPALPLSASVTAASTPPQAVGSTVAFTANATGGFAPLQYKWWIFDGTTWSVLRTWGTGNTFSWTPGTANANYVMGVWVRSSGNTTDAPEVYASMPFAIQSSVTRPPITVTMAANLAVPQPAGTTVTFTATASGGIAPLQYEWWQSDGVTWTVVRTWGTSNTFAWTPGTANANYIMGVWVRSAGNTTDAPEVYASMPFAIQGSVTRPPITATVTANAAAPQPAGTTVTFTATASGGIAPLQYEWWLSDGVTWTMVRTWSTSNTFAWTPGTPNANYVMGVWVRSAGNTVDSPEVYATMPFAIQARASITATVGASAVAPQRVGTAITFTATASGGIAPLQYKWWVYDGINWYVLRTWGTSNTFRWTPLIANANYVVGVWVRSAGNTTDAPEVYATLPFGITP